MDKDPKPIPLGRFTSERLNKRRFILQQDPHESDVDSEIVNAIRAIRNTGIETIASSAGATESPFKGWGSYIQINLMIFPGGKKIAKKINQFAKIITPELRKELNNPNIALQFVSAERWRDDEKTTSMKITQHDIYRLQLVGFANDDEIRFAWNKVAERFTPSVIQ